MTLAISDILKAITLEVNMITRQINPFFSSTLLALSFVLFHVKTYQIPFSGIPPMHYVLFCKIIICMSKKTFKPVNIDILIQYKTS